MKKEEFDLYKSRLIANLSHELKTPLTIIMAMVDTLISDSDISPEQRKKYLDRIYYNASALTQLIDDIITLHKIETQPKDIVFEKYTKTKNLFADIEEMLLLTEGRKLEFVCSLGEISINQQHMLSILVNLIKNALTYTKSKTIVTEIMKKNGFIIIRVIDEGPAIAKEERNKIFERFYTVSKSRALNRAGTGLGLSIVKHIAFLYSGSVRVEETPQGGNAFTVELMEE